MDSGRFVMQPGDVTEVTFPASKSVPWEELPTFIRRVFQDAVEKHQETAPTARFRRSSHGVVVKDGYYLIRYRDDVSGQEYETQITASGGITTRLV